VFGSGGQKGLDDGDEEIVGEIAVIEGRMDANALLFLRLGRQAQPAAYKTKRQFKVSVETQVGV